jgi:hypothetical protein
MTASRTKKRIRSTTPPKENRASQRFDDGDSSHQRETRQPSPSANSRSTTEPVDPRQSPDHRWQSLKLDAETVKNTTRLSARRRRERPIASIRPGRALARLTLELRFFELGGEDPLADLKALQNDRLRIG